MGYPWRVCESGTLGTESLIVILRCCSGCWFENFDAFNRRVESAFAGACVDEQGDELVELTVGGVDLEHVLVRVDPVSEPFELPQFRIEHAVVFHADDCALAFELEDVVNISPVECLVDIFIHVRSPFE